MMRPQDGFSLVEVLVATTLLMLLVGGLFGVLQPAHAMFLVQPERQDLQQRLRVVVDALREDLASAGAGVPAGRGDGRLLQYFSPVLPYHFGELRSDPAAGIFHRADVITLVDVPQSGVVASVEGLTVHGSTAVIDTEPCATATGACGFAPDMRVVLFDATGRASFATVTTAAGDLVSVTGRLLDDQIDAPTATLAQVRMTTYAAGWDAGGSTPRLTRASATGPAQPVVDHVVRLAFAYHGDPAPPGLTGASGLPSYGPAPPPVGIDDPRDSWPAGENCLFSVASGVHVPRLPALGTAGLVPLSPGLLTDGPWCPDADSPARYDADLLRIRAILVSVRVQVGVPAMRGPAGPLFAIAGTGRDPSRLVPDADVQFLVAPPNLRRVTQ